MFETKNALDAGGYYAGMTPDVILDRDYGDFDFGNPSEQLLAAAIDILVPKTAGVSVVSRNKVMSVSPGASEGSVIGKFDQNKEFVGMIENRPVGKQ
ncbi:hypothetical protein D3C86_1738310 [compost metagenome]